MEAITYPPLSHVSKELLGGNRDHRLIIYDLITWQYNAMEYDIKYILIMDISWIRYKRTRKIKTIQHLNNFNFVNNS